MEPNVAMLEDVVIDGVTYQREWWGSKHRDVFPQPEIARPRELALHPEKPTTMHGRATVAAMNRARVRAAFDYEWATANQLAARADMTVQGVRRHLREALDDGIAEYKIVKSPRAWGRSERHFRRRRVSEQAA